MSRVWVTRPSKQAEVTSQKLRALGVQPWCQPVMEIRPITPLGPISRQQVMDLNLYQFAIFVSQNAVQYGCDLIEQFWPQVPLGVTFVAVGSATADALAGRGLLAEAPTAAMDSEGVLALASLQQVEQQRVIIFKGEAGRTTLAETLAERGARVDNCELYARSHCTAAVAALRDGNFGLELNDTTLAYSGHSVELIHQTLLAARRTELLKQPLVVPGKRVAAVAGELGFEQVRTAQNATDQAMLAALGLT